MEAVLVQEIELDEKALVRRSQAGDRDAFGSLVKLHMQKAYYAALGLVHSQDAALDLSQDAFARAYRARQSLDPDRPFYPWLYQILRRLCFNHTRDCRTRRDHVQANVSWLAERGAGGAGMDPSVLAERAELKEKLAAAIEALPDREREVLVMKEFENLKYREIAELLGIPLGTVMSRLFSARQGLTTAMGVEP